MSRAMNLLIVDDYPTNRRLLRAQLEGESHNVLEASNGIEALQLLEVSAVDAIISDILMPNMDGYRLCREIRQDPRFAALPLILYTSTYNSPKDRQLAQTVGADCYLLKPAPTAAILKAIDDAMHGTSSRARDVAQPDENYVLKRYNEALVRKLEDTNTELHHTLDELRGAHEQILAMNRDLEERVRQRTAALDAANRELESFSYSVSHDLRAPLRHVSGFVGLLEQRVASQLDEQNLDLLHRIGKSAKHMAQLVDNLLEFARVDKVKLRIVDVQLDVLARETIAELAVDTQGRDIEWIVHSLPQVRGDANLLRQVFVNLLANAVKYSRTRAHARIEIGCESIEAVGCTIFVRDNGVGFDSRRAGELFGVFKRLHSAKEFEGTGVGLAHAHRIVARHGGRIWAESAADVGATFRFTLPMQ
jgi:two-component system sensor histidine kinase/response regulator